MFPRLYASRLHEALRHFPCVAIVGPRQCGKTTFLSELPNHWRRLDLERDADLQEMTRDPDLFFRLNPDAIAIDEAQVAPAIFPALRVAIDADRQRPGRFVITGSSSPDLTHAISESLAGRILTIEMAPFSAAEAHRLPLSPLFTALDECWPVEAVLDTLQPRLDVASLHDWWFFGGYPEPWTRGDDRFHALWMEQYLRAYVERDVARLYPRLNAERFRQFARLLGPLSGSILNISDIARALGISQPTARDYLEIAHGTFLWRQLPAFSRNPLKRVVKAPKGHLRDSGLLHHLLRVPDLPALRSHPRLGASWEGTIVEEVLRGLVLAGVPFDAWHYRTAGGAEIDLIIEGAFGLVPIEVKYSSTIDGRQLRAIRTFVREYDCPWGLVLSNDDKLRRLDEKVIGIPTTCL